MELRELDPTDRRPPMPTTNIVLPFNVLTHLDVRTERATLRRVRTVTSPEGFRFLGGAETTTAIDDVRARAPAGAAMGA